MEFNQKEKFVTISGPSGGIEACIHQPSTSGALYSRHFVVVICHPHPVHGGTMENKVVTTLVRTYRDLGVVVIRFNFRGVGKSQGSFDHGIGEVDDVMAVTSFAANNFPHHQLLLAGFSFGSSMAAQASFRLEDCKHLTLVAAPVERYPYDRDGAFLCPTIIVQGDVDERVNAAGVYEWCANLKTPVQLLRYADAGHFFHGFLANIKHDLHEALQRDLL